MAVDRDFSKLRAVITDLDAAANDRLADAEALKTAGRNAAAIALGLYALEIRLKERICRRLDLDGLPIAFEIHDLGGLLILSGLQKQLYANSPVLANWNEIEIVSKELNELRYKPESQLKWLPSKVAPFFTQLRDPPDGVLPWLATQP